MQINSAITKLVITVSLLSLCACAGLPIRGELSTVKSRRHIKSPYVGVVSRIEVRDTKLSDSMNASIKEAATAAIYNSGRFKYVHFEDQPSGSLNVPIYFELIIVPIHNSSTNWWVSWPAIFPMPFYWPVQMSKGDFDVRIDVKVILEGSDYKNFSIESSEKYEKVIYGFFDNRPNDAAFRIATDEAFVKLTRVLGRLELENEDMPATVAKSGYFEGAGTQTKIVSQGRASAGIRKSPENSARDTTAPIINVPADIKVDYDRPTVSGRVTDNDAIAQLTVEGRPLELGKNGSFSFERYVPAGGTTVLIVATDEWGNKSEKVVHLSREVTAVAAPVFSMLDPTGFSVQQNPDAVALIIGIGDYKDAVEAQYADKDAETFGDYARRKLGVPARGIKVLTNENADIADIIKATRIWLPQATQAGTSDIYVFFAGHGLASEDGKEVYLLPYNGVPEVLDRTALLRSELFASLEAVKPRSVTVFLDTCYSGTSRDEEALMAARPVMLVAKEQAIPAGFTVFSAASMEQTAKMLPAAEHGLFSYYLMKGMEGGADTNSDKSITAGELHEYILRNATRLQRNQTPQLHGDAGQVLVQW
jgi:hypothetical protein